MASSPTDSKQHIIDPLLSETASNGNENASVCKKWFCALLLCPLYMVSYPLISVLDGRGVSCLKNKEYQQHDLSLQFEGVFVNLVALFWSNSLVSMIEHLLNTNMTVLITASYALSMYLFYILMMMMTAKRAKTSKASETYSFFLGLFLKMIAFGVKDFGFQVQDIYFAESLRYTLSFFFLQLIIAVLFLSASSSIRHRCGCREQTKNENIKESKTCKDNDHDPTTKKWDKLHRKRMAKKKRHQNAHKKYVENRRRTTDWNRRMNGLDADIWTISLGFCLVEVVICGLSGKWIPLAASVVHQESIRDVDALYFLYLFLSLCLIWILWLNGIASFEVRRDRLYQKVFLMANYVQIGRTNIDQFHDEYVIHFTNKLLEETSSDSTTTKDRQQTYLLFPKRLSPTADATRSAVDGYTEGFYALNCWYRLLFSSGFKYKNAMDRVVVFMDGILGWSMGWSMAGAIFLNYRYEYRLIFAVIATAICMAAEIMRNWYIHKLRENHFCCE